MDKKIICSFSALAVCIILTGCCMSHEWKEATCTEPKTCTKCGEIEGEALGHTWTEATCAEAKHCSVCGETEGEPLAHTWVEATCAEAKHCNVCGETEGAPLEHSLTEANYQQAATCEVCRATVGEPLQAYFEKYGLVCDAELDTTYTYTVPCSLNQDYTTEEKITFSDYEIFESDDNHEAEDGYEWRAVTLTMVFDDDNARNYGLNGLSFGYWDYYDETWNETDTVVFSYNGVDTPECMFDYETFQNGWNDNGICITEWRLYFRTPIGYDGIVASLYRKENMEYFRDLAGRQEDYICFRLK